LPKNCGDGNKDHTRTDNNSVVRWIKDKAGWYSHQLDGAQLGVEAVTTDVNWQSVPKSHCT